MPSEKELFRKLSHERDTTCEAILSRVSDAVVALDKDWHYTYVNEQAAALFGRTPAELVGKHIWTEFPEGVGQPFQLHYEEAMREQRSSCFEDYYAPWDRWFENRLYPSSDGITIFFQEITERKKADLQVRVNSRELLGLTADEMFPPDFARKITADDIAVVKQGKSIELDEEFNGRSFVTIKFPIERGGKDSLLAGYTIDITERKLAEKVISQYADIVQNMQVGLYVYLE